MKKSKLLIPVLGISSLAATVAPVMTITSCNKGTTVNDSDKQFLTTINSYLSYKTDLVSPHKAIEALKNLDYDVLSFQLSSSQFEFAFDASVKKFIIMKGDEVVAKPDGYKMTSTNTVFKFVKTHNADSKYGEYLLDDFEWSDPTETFYVKNSVDVGNNTNIKHMVYTSDSTTTKTVLLRTYCEELDTYQACDMIYHMGVANNTNAMGGTTGIAKFIELGKVAYLYAQNVILSVNSIDKVDCAQIDVLETASDSSVTKGVTFVKDYVGALIGKKIQGVDLVPTEVTDVDEESELTAALTAAKPFIRLDADITLSAALPIKNITTIIDFQGHNLIDEVTIAQSASLPVITIGATDATDATSVTLINSIRNKLGTYGVIQLKADHHIQISGNTDDTILSVLYLEGVNITHSAVSYRAGAIQVGTKDEDSKYYQVSRLYMFGGRIISTTTAEGHDVQACGVQVLQDAYFQMIYGSIISDTICVRSNGQYEGATIELVNATLVNSRTTEGMCIYMANGELLITNGLYIGHCCLGMRGGQVEIAGGYFHAYGEESTDLSEVSATSSGIETDGSVICVQLSASTGTTTYGVDPCITVRNATLQSDNSYILQMFRGKNADITQFYEADFWGGVYYYAKEPTASTYTGIRIDTNVAGYSRINQYSGSWICTGEE